ncbi:MAG TPA: transcriptional regulator [Parvularcula sp.]|nr:transcriptional regulator [Parvularcula sp.]HBS34304.1 transcriptional regulator [Parvularcula sp.]
MNRTFGDVLRDWRQVRRMSQLDLALAADVSARHISFLESGRASPSRAMTLKLAAALDMPKVAANEALASAGFAAAYPVFAPDAPDLAPIRRAISMTLMSHHPFPGIAINRTWDVLEANESARQLLAALGGGPNMIEFLIFLGALDILENWEETAFLALLRLRSEIVLLGGDARLSAYAARLAAHPRLQTADPGAIDLDQAVIPAVFRLGDKRLSVFSTIALFGSVQDVAASEIRIELMYPADDATAAFFRSFAAA